MSTTNSKRHAGGAYKASSLIILLLSTGSIVSMVYGLPAGQQNASRPEATTNVASSSPTTTQASAILSSHEFVDFTETPTLLIDGLANESPGSESRASQPQAEVAPLEPSASFSISQSPADSGQQATSTPPPPPTTGTPIPEKEESDATSTDEPSHSTATQAPIFEPPKNVSQYMDYIEQLFHDLRHQIFDLFEPHLPQLIRSSQMVQLSGSCSYDMLRMALALRQFEPWALRMIDSSGKVPEGIFEGSFTALGSYDECLATVFSNPDASDPPTQGKYCLVNISPFLPPKPPADKVDLMFREEANRRNYSKDDHFSRLSPMFYYMKFRIGLCIPSSCIDSDMESIGATLSSSLRLNISITDCRIKQETPITRHQLIGGLVFGMVLALVLLASVGDCWNRELVKLRRQDEMLVLANVACQRQSMSSKADAQRIDLALKDNKLNGFQAQGPSVKQMAEHQIWMSFSALANFRLHFSGGRDKRHPVERTMASGDRTDKRKQKQIVACLNGIRVLSVCWVIVANSYITLDPRATKRLVKTREAPRDFLFQLVAQASLAIETFFFLSGLLVSLSFARRLNTPTYDGSSRVSSSLRWLQFYLHRYMRMTPATMLVIAFTMFAFRFGDGPLWSEATHKAHLSCNENWWRHLIHVANYIDTRQMCFIHYWYVSADMQLFLLAPILLLLLYRRKKLGYSMASCLALASFGFVFYKTYSRNLPPTLLFYNSDPESRREFGNAIMTKPLTHALPYMVGLFLGKWLSDNQREAHTKLARLKSLTSGSLGPLIGLTAVGLALAEIFLPYKWNNSQLPSKLSAAIYAALFRLSWSLVLGYLVLSCGHRKGRRCKQPDAESGSCCSCNQRKCQPAIREPQNDGQHESLCFCGFGGNFVNRFLGLRFFVPFSKLSFVAYLIHLPLMSVFVAQTRTLFSFSHTLVIHLALSYLVMTFSLSFFLVHIIEFPFLTYESQFFARFQTKRPQAEPTPKDGMVDKQDHKMVTIGTTMGNKMANLHSVESSTDKQPDDSMISQRL